MKIQNKHYQKVFYFILILEFYNLEVQWDYGNQLELIYLSGLVTCLYLIDSRMLSQQSQYLQSRMNKPICSEVGTVKGDSFGEILLKLNFQMTFQCFSRKLDEISILYEVK